MLQELEKLEANLGGVADLRRQPDAVFIVDLRKSSWRCASAPARRADHALVDTVRPGRGRLHHPRQQTRSGRSLIVRAIADGIAAGQGKVTEQELAAANGSGATAAAGEAGRYRRAAERARGRCRGGGARPGGGRDDRRRTVPAAHRRAAARRATAGARSRTERARSGAGRADREAPASPSRPPEPTARTEGGSVSTIAASLVKGSATSREPR